jgi:hypothetical protein
VPEGRRAGDLEPEGDSERRRGGGRRWGGSDEKRLTEEEEEGGSSARVEEEGGCGMKGESNAGTSARARPAEGANEGAGREAREGAKMNEVSSLVLPFCSSLFGSSGSAAGVGNGRSPTLGGEVVRV